MIIGIFILRVNSIAPPTILTCLSLRVEGRGCRVERAVAVSAEIYVIHFNIRRASGNKPIPESSGLLLPALLARHGSLLVRVSLIRLISRFTAVIYPDAVSLFRFVANQFLLYPLTKFQEACIVHIRFNCRWIMASARERNNLIT